MRWYRQYLFSSTPKILPLYFFNTLTVIKAKSGNIFGVKLIGKGIREVLYRLQRLSIQLFQQRSETFYGICDFGYACQHPHYLKGADRGKNILSGSRHFETVEIEIYA